MINGETFISKEDTQAATLAAVAPEQLPFVVVRSRDSGCHFGYLQRRDKDEVILINSRRIWSWEGAATLSQFAVDGPKRPVACKSPCEVPEMIVIGVCEIIYATEKAQSKMKEIPVWEA